MILYVVVYLSYKSELSDINYYDLNLVRTWLFNCFGCGGGCLIVLLF